jgi:hypothetical protein
MKKLDGISLTAVLAAASAALAACGDAGQDDAWRVCVDNQGRRIVDQQCPATGTTSSGSHWYYMRGAAPAIGGYVSGGSTSADDRVSYVSPPAEGGISRGGFGSTAGESGDGGGDHGGGDGGGHGGAGE